MKGKSFIGEWKSIFTNKSLLIPIIAVMLIPVLYAGMFLYAFWDPYDRLSELPVVIVNEDQGATFENEKMKLGDKLADNLHENKQFKFVNKPKQQAYQDLNDQKYYMLVEIPENFSKNATTILDEEPKKLELKYVPNEAYNFLSAQIGDTAMEKIKAAVSEEITKTYSETVFDKVKTMADGYQNASKNANTLYDGVSKVNDGTKTIKEKLELLASKQIEFKSGIDQVYDGLIAAGKGSQSLNNGLVQLSRAHGQLENGTVEVKQGIDTLASKSGQLIGGINQAADGSQKVSSGLQEASSKSKELAVGANQVKDGVAQLAGKTPALASGANNLSQGAEGVSQGASGLSEGAAKLQAGIQKLNENLAPVLASLPPDAQQALKSSLSELQQGSGQLAAKSGELATGAGKLASGANELKAGANQLNAGAAQLKDGAVKVSNGAGALSSGLGELNNGSQTLNNGLGQLAAGSGQLKDGIGQLQNGQNKVVAGMQQYGQKFNEAVKGSQDLNSGLTKLTGGATQLADGSGQLANGTNQLSAGAKELQDGTVKVEDGTKQFKDELGKAADESSKVNADDKTYDMMSKPVEVDKKAVDPVPNYGTGFAPYFLSLGLFVGALMLSIVFPLFEPAVQPKNGFTWFLSKFGVLAIVGVLQALIADAIMLLLLGIDVQSVPLFILFSIVTSLVFMTLIQFFVTTLGNPGRFIAILLLIFQLTTSAGTFPLELLPKSLQIFNPFLPMTYTVRGYKTVISSGDYSYMWQNIGVLAIFIAVFIIGTIGYFIFKHKRRYSGITSENTVEA